MWLRIADTTFTGLPTNGVLSEHWFGGRAGVSQSHNVLRTDSELVLAALQQIWYPVLHRAMDLLLVTAGPSDRNSITMVTIIIISLVTIIIIIITTTIVITVTWVQS